MGAKFETCLQISNYKDVLYGVLISVDFMYVCDK